MTSTRIKVILVRMLMLLRTYRLVRLVHRITKEKYKNTIVLDWEPDWEYDPTITELREKYRIFTRDDGKKRHVFKRTMQFAAANSYIIINAHGSSDDYRSVKVSHIEGERLLEGWLYWGYIKELLRVNNFLATLILALVAIFISILAYTRQ